VSESKSVAAWKSCSVLAKAKANEVDCGLHMTMLGKHYANANILPIKHRKFGLHGLAQRPVQVQQTCQTSWTVSNGAPCANQILKHI